MIRHTRAPRPGVALLAAAGGVAGKALAALVAVGLGCGAMGWVPLAHPQEPGPGASELPEAAGDRCARPIPPPPGSSGSEVAPWTAELRAAHRFATGAGVKVAVIDTGVAPNPLLPEVRPLADLLEPGAPPDGAHHDCDGHGTVVAGIIAGRSPDGGSEPPLGIAPDATLVSIRQSSSRISTKDNTPTGTLGTLTTAINRALDDGAHVINVSVVSCVPAANHRLDTSRLDAALARAEQAGTVVVAAAGNATSQCQAGDAVYPAHRPTVLAVAAREDDYTLAPYSLPGPAGSPDHLVSAPGHVAFGLAPERTGNPLAAGVVGPGQDPASAPATGFDGTSFAAPVITGTVALLRQRHPGASAAELRERVYAAAVPGTGAVSPHLAIGSLAPELPAPHPASAAEPVAPERGPLLRATGILGFLAVAGGGVLCARAIAGADRRVGDGAGPHR